MTDPFARPTDDELLSIIRDWAAGNGGLGAVAIAIMRLNSPIYENEISCLTLHDILRTLGSTIVLHSDAQEASD